MLLVRLSASDQRLIERATSLEELKGIRQRMVDLIQQSLVLKELGKTPVVKKQAYNWLEAWKICVEVLGVGGITKPPFPDASWYVRINNVLRTYAMDDDSVRDLATYAKHNLRSPTSFDFLICQHPRILAGEFGKKTEVTQALANVVQLPED